MPALLMVGHGTRDPAGVDEFHQTVSLVAELVPDVEVRPAFLELAEPTIGQALASLAADGHRRIVAVPLLLLAAGHAKEDIPHELALSASLIPDGQLRLAKHLGCESHLLQLSQDRMTEALPAEPCEPEERVVILVGRGNRDPSAWREMDRFATEREKKHPGTAIRVAYLSMAAPGLADVMEEIAASDFRQVVVQPHLLFRGELLTQLQEKVAEMNARSQQSWFAARHLGPTPLLAQAVISRYLEELGGKNADNNVGEVI